MLHGSGTVAERDSKPYWAKSLNYVIPEKLDGPGSWTASTAGDSLGSIGKHAHV